jgi:hypothetical protein
MDNEALNELLRNPTGRDFWIVLWGDPERLPDEFPQVFDEPEIEHWFPMHPASINVSDILFVHRIGVASLIFVAEVALEARQATAEELAKDPRHKRWAWVVDTKNLTPTFGSHWRKHRLKTFALSKEYNRLNPQERVKVGRLQFGAPVRISQGFAKFLLGQIIRL